MDQAGILLAIVVQCRRDKATVKKGFRTFLKGLTDVPSAIVTGQPGSYNAAKRGVWPSVGHRQHRT